jgi:hypothetical protein
MRAWTSALRRRGPAVALAASLLLNAFFIGVIVAESMRGPREHRLPRFAGYELRRLADRLPEEAVETIAADLRRLGPTIDGQVERIREARREIGRLAAEPEPDRAAIDARLADVRSESAAMQETVQKATYDAVLALPADMRTRLAEAGER